MINLDSQKRLLIGGEVYKSWPDFRPVGVKTRQGRWWCRRLTDALSTDDLFCEAWRAPIPRDVIETVLRFPDGHAELIELAQLDPGRFLRLCRSNPALARVIAAYWTHGTGGRRPSRLRRNERRRELMQLPRHEVLPVFGLPSSREVVRILGKVPAAACYEFLLRDLLELCRDRAVRRRLRHLPSVNEQVLWVLGLNPRISDMGILKLAATEPEHQGVPLGTVVGAILSRREMLRLEPLWPYHGKLGSWTALARAEVRLAMRCEQSPLTSEGGAQ